MLRGLYIFILLICSAVAFSQKTEKVTATYTYYAPENVTLEEAKRTALDRAKISAIADAFGTIVTQSNTNVMSNQNGRTDSRFFSLGGSEVKGEWIETIKDPVYKINYEGDMLVVSVEVSGRIREITDAGIDFTAKILRNGTEEKFESIEFRSGDDMYLYFKSPVDGYLTVYLLDETSQDVFCLLPYRASGEGAYRIEHDKPYVLFSSKHEAYNPSIVDEYNMTCSSEREFNDVYVIFSPNPFAKANASESMNDVLPRQLSFENFQKWLAKLRKKDKNSCVKKTGIVIKR
ncbi:MAG: DUF4384 domain-containing protein [Prevotella sp.]|nr:DUF4384 domain-containing protein [Prevotella sp.]